MRNIFFISLLFIPLLSFSQKKLLQSGPMVGYSEMLEVAIWVQTKKSASVKIRYWKNYNKNKFYWTNTIQTCKTKGFTAKLIADTLEPGNRYSYQLYINNIAIDLKYKTSFQTLSIWRWRTDPPDFSFASGSGTYINESRYDRPGKPYGGGYEIFNSILNKKPDFMLWLGDNIYLREPDWNSWTGIIHRYTHTRSISEMQALLASVHHYAILDDHDFGPNNSNRSFWNKNSTLKAFELFWANPSMRFDDMNAAITYFNWNDADFFLLDNRTFRSPNHQKTGNKTMLGLKQLNWLKESLISSNATFKFIVTGGQFLNSAAQSETYSNYGFDKERQKIINFIRDENIKGVVFITGDRHHTELSILKKDNYPAIYDLTVSPLTSGVHTNANKENNAFQVPGTLVMKRNFSIINVSGKKSNRKLTINIYDTFGKLIWTKDISEKDF